MAVYKVLYEIVTIDAGPHWGLVEPLSYQHFTEITTSKALSWNWAEVSPTNAIVTMYFESKEKFDEYVVWRNTLPEFLARQAYEAENNIIRNLTFEGYVDEIE